MSTVFLGIESVLNNHLLISLSLDFPTPAFESLGKYINLHFKTPIKEILKLNLSHL